MSTDIDQFEDIDYNSRDVFETSDVEISAEQSTTSSSHSKRSSIEVIEYSPADSRAAFEKEIVDKGRTSFGDKIFSAGEGSYQSYALSETYEQRLERIKKELEELEILKHETNEFRDKDEELEKLMVAVAEKLSTQASVKSTNSSFPDIQKIGVSARSEPIVDLPLELIQKFDSRISDLEKTVGYSDALEEQNDFSIQVLINDLYRKLNIMSNSDFNKANVRPLIESFNRQNSRAESRRNVPFSKDVLGENLVDEKKIEAIYSKLLTLPNFETVLPAILAKLKSIHSLNVELAKGVNDIDTHQNQIFTLESSFAEWQDWLKKYETKLDEMETKTQANQSEIKAWLDRIEGKLTKLH